MRDRLLHFLNTTPGSRYAAWYQGGEPVLCTQPGLVNASASESDRYEEILVNPTILSLLRRRGEIDCGGLSHVVIRYGAFHQIVAPAGKGHVSVAFEPDHDLGDAVAAVLDLAEEAATRS